MGHHIIFEGTHYEAWRVYVTMGIRANNDFESLLSASDVEEAYIASKFQELCSSGIDLDSYRRRQEAAKNYIFSHLSLPIIDKVRRCKTLRQVFDKLDTEYGDSTRF